MAAQGRSPSQPPPPSTWRPSSPPPPPPSPSPPPPSTSAPAPEAHPASARTRRRCEPDRTNDPTNRGPDIEWQHIAALARPDDILANRLEVSSDRSSLVATI